MDTRTKIVPMQEAERIAAEGATIVSGYFDPLLVSHAERLHGLKRPGVPLIVIVADPQNPILPVKARAELVAGLAVVDHVVDSGSGRLAPCPEEIVHLEEEDAQTLEALIERVHRRQEASS
jgi:bifunctional ADP-heptose synthase (sugar kinase/adenylyltransferase)